MQLYIRSSDWQNANQYFGVSYDADKSLLTVELYSQNEDKLELVSEKAFALSPMFKANNYFLIHLTPKAGKLGFSEFIDMNNISRSRDELYTQMVFERTYDYPAIVVYFHNAADETVVFVNGAVKTDYPYELADDRPAYLIAQQVYPDLVKTTAVWEARKQMLWDLDPNQSLAYMEAQLDAVTKALFLLLDQLPDAKEKVLESFPELKDFESELNSTSVFTVKSAAKCLDEISNIKAKVRQLQMAYYQVKQQNQ